ncbi:hypothetical protein [Ktedonospora formicarum]|uniref:Uncharacterized protein n=1 Tax=Ktedonospora formicarum TaxID=2778364 RepID=A0A8J3MUY5_9CHLR|nr:hypothetical protein [Ktedonospora formicarum]GHO45905.1 hypothetical protein KSX_40680 [Ktedonospora formicarum]
MEKEAALAILEALVDGLNPYTNERLPQESPFVHSSTKRALQMAVVALEATGVPSQKELAEDRWAIPLLCYSSPFFPYHTF